MTYITIITVVMALAVIGLLTQPVMATHMDAPTNLRIEQKNNFLFIDWDYPDINGIKFRITTNAVGSPQYIYWTSFESNYIVPVDNFKTGCTVKVTVIAYTDWLDDKSKESKPSFIQICEMYHNV